MSIDRRKVDALISKMKVCVGLAKAIDDSTACDQQLLALALALDVLIVDLGEDLKGTKTMRDSNSDLESAIATARKIAQGADHGRS